jgi:predicted nuclease of restriction endonuclease-like (RecB) superfamily
LLGDIRQMIEETRAAVAATVNAGLTMLYWKIGSMLYERTALSRKPDELARLEPVSPCTSRSPASLMVDRRSSHSRRSEVQV